MKQAKLRTDTVKLNNNITFPIGTILTVQKYSEKPDFDKLFREYKKKGRDLTKTTKNLLIYFTSCRPVQV